MRSLGGGRVRVLVTGTSGFIGTNFCERFGGSRRYDVVGVDCREPGETFPGVQHVTLDLRDGEAVRRTVLKLEPDTIVHLAAQARVEPSLVDPIDTYRRNVVSTVNLLEAALALGNRLDRFFYASSETVYGPAHRYPTPEEETLRPQSAYAASKAASEFLVRNANGLPHLIFRSAMGYGPRSNPQEQVVAKFIAKALSDEPIRFPQGLPESQHPTRDINHVQNYLEAMERALAADARGTFNVGSGRETSILCLARRIVELAGSGSLAFDPAYAYRPGEVGLRTWLDTRKAEAAFGYRPRVSLDEGLRATLAWYTEHPDQWSSARRAVPATEGKVR